MVRIKSVIVSTGQILRHKKITLQAGKSYTSGHTIWSGGYFHWITEALPRLSEAAEFDRSVVAVIPEQDRMAPVQLESVRALGIDESLTIPRGHYVKADNFIFTECPKEKALFSPEIMTRMRARILSTIVNGNPAKAHRKIYVSRDKSRGRRVRNESEVEIMLAKIGFERVCFEDYDFRGQVALMAETKVLVSIHGAGLSNVVFMPKGGAVVEITADPQVASIFASVRKSWKASPTYVRLASIMGHEYAVCFCKEIHKDGSLFDLTVDLNQLRSVLNAVNSA